VHFSPLKKLTTFLVVALKTQAKTTKLTTLTVQISYISKKWTLGYGWEGALSAWGASTTFPL